MQNLVAKLLLCRLNAFSSLKNFLRLSSCHLTIGPEHLRAGTSTNSAVVPFSVKQHTGPPTAILISMYLNSSSRVYGGELSSVSLARWVGASDYSASGGVNNNVIRWWRRGVKWFHLEGRRAYARTSYSTQPSTVGLRSVIASFWCW